MTAEQPSSVGGQLITTAASPTLPTQVAGLDVGAILSSIGTDQAALASYVLVSLFYYRRDLSGRHKSASSHSAPSRPPLPLCQQSVRHRRLVPLGRRTGPRGLGRQCDSPGFSPPDRTRAEVSPLLACTLESSSARSGADLRRVCPCSFAQCDRSAGRRRKDFGGGGYLWRSGWRSRSPVCYSVLGDVVSLRRSSLHTVNLVLDRTGCCPGRIRCRRRTPLDIQAPLISTVSLSFHTLISLASLASCRLRLAARSARTLLSQTPFRTYPSIPSFLRICLSLISVSLALDSNALLTAHWS